MSFPLVSLYHQCFQFESTEFLKKCFICLQVKLEQNSANGPSRVVHIRSLPPDCTEADVVQLGMPYGKMSNVLLLKQKNQVYFLKMFNVAQTEKPGLIR